jgi:hypothetical protein
MDPGCPVARAGSDVSGGRRLERSKIMKYMIMMYGSQRDYDDMTGASGSWTPEHFAAIGAFMEKFNRDLAETGVLVDTRGLAAPVHTRRVHARDGVRVVTDGPYAETQEVLAGYWVVECDSFDHATEIALRLTECPGPPEVGERAYVDVRPIADSQGDLLE